MEKLSRRILILHGVSNVQEGNKLYNLGYEVIHLESPYTKIRIIGWMIGCFKVVKASKNSDIIYCRYDFQAVMVYWICMMLGLRRSICCENILLKDKDTLINHAVRFLYKKALTSKNFHASVTSPAYGEMVKKYLGGVNFKYVLIHDLFHGAWTGEQAEAQENSVFVGGSNGRDWPFMIEIVKRMPYVNFTFVMTRDAYDNYVKVLPPIVKAKTSIPLNDFMIEITKSSIVCLPIDTEAPAGLIVVFQAAGCGKMVIITKTVSSQEYVTEERGCPLNRKPEEWIDAINFYLKNKEIRQKKAKALYDFLCSQCGKDKYIEGVQKLINLCDLN